MCYPGIHECTRDAMALTEKQEKKVQVCETNLVRRIVVVKRTDKRRTDKLRMDVGVKDNVKKKLAGSSLTWAVLAETMGNEKLAKGADSHKVEGKRGERGRKLRWVIA